MRAVGVAPGGVGRFDASSLKTKLGSPDMLRVTIAAALLCMGGSALAQPAGWEAYLDQVRIKQAIADQLTPEQLQERRERLAQWLAQRAADGNANGPLPGPNVGAGTCPAATNETGALPFSTSGTTVGAGDDYDLPATVTAPTCTAPVTCTGAGPAGSLPRGAIYTGTGTGPDFAYRIRTDAACTVTISADPTGTDDLALILYPSTCSSSLADCGCVDDTGVGGAAESISLTTVANTDYFVVIDGYSAGATPPGPAGPFDFSVTGTGCALVGAGTPPVFGYTPPAGGTVNFATGPIGGSAAGSIAVAVTTPGTGTGAAATTSISCTAPTAPFAGFNQTISAEGAGALTGGNALSGTCTRGPTAVTQTLTCSQVSGGITTSQTWTLNCPAGFAAPQAVDTLSDRSLWTLLALVLALGLVAVGIRRVV